MLALTGTAKIKVREEVAAHLAIKTPIITDAPMDVPNIKIQITKRNPNCGLHRTVEVSFESTFQPLV